QESNRRNCGGLERHLVACGFLFLRLAVSATGSAAAPSPSLTFHSRKVFEKRTRIHQNLRFCSSSDTFFHFAKAKTDLLLLFIQMYFCSLLICKGELRSPTVS
ncbi:MAG: hypothetical protein IJN27_01085, partial [Oscillospiraceae bacterium]|nr:hypothetical protein [Oscillospiraceae bacterium]